MVGELLKLVRIPSEAHKELPFLRRMGRLLSISKVSLVQLPARAKIRPLMRALPWPTYEKLLNAAAAAVGSAIKIVAKPTSGDGLALFVVELLRNDRVVVPATLRAAAASRQSGRGHAGSRATFRMRWDRAGTPALASRRQLLGAGSLRRRPAVCSFRPFWTSSCTASRSAAWWPSGSC